ncbi:thioesterase family protein [Sphingomonas ginkgonis]|uniref:Thioesterase family protein n=1 Tax=Sphingomonas ginkgonis TaxID=2315330 RepID=A0A3R9WQ76_9SPHN|nr:thioesterase family protein [Sphingomonas ginkgonis]RST31743.1 thioesterase family protein [Sphingomonas ginkgonis]
MATLGAVVGGLHADGEIYRAHVTPNWMQGRTTYGGASSALAVAAALKAFPDLPPLRSAQIAWTAPLGGEIEARPTLLRQGRSASFVRVELSAGEQVGLAALLLFAAPRESEIAVAPPLLAPLPPRLDPIPAPDRVEFGKNFEIGSTGHDRRGIPSIMHWVRLKDRSHLHPLVELFALADGPPPATITLFPRPAPLSSMTWQVNLLTPEPHSEDGWWLIRADADSADGGFSSQSMKMWNSAGQLVAVATQTVALFV